MCLNILNSVPRFSYTLQFSLCVTIRAPGFAMLLAFYYVFKLYASVGGSSDCKIVFLFLYVGG